MEIGRVRARRGAIERGYLDLAEYPDGAPIASALTIAQGEADGRVLWVQGCVHGPEIVGPLAIQSFLSTLDVTRLRGAVVCLAAANPLALRSQSRLTPQDGANLNRVYPGHPDGGLSEQMAYRSFAAALAAADALLDLHSGGDHLVCCHHAIFHDDGSQAGRGSAELARSTGAPNLWRTPAGVLQGAAFLSFLHAGKPAVLVESGGGGRVTAEDIDNLAQAIRGACIHLGILPGDGPAPLSPRRVGSRVVWLRSTRGGLFHAAVEPGQDVRAGDAIGHISDFHGRTVEHVTAPFGPAWVASVRRPFMPVYSGEDLAELVADEAG